MIKCFLCSERILQNHRKNQAEVQPFLLYVCIVCAELRDAGIDCVISASVYNIKENRLVSIKQKFMTILTNSALPLPSSSDKDAADSHEYVMSCQQPRPPPPNAAVFRRLRNKIIPVKRRHSDGGFSKCKKAPKVLGELRPADPPKRDERDPIMFLKKADPL